MAVNTTWYIRAYATNSIGTVYGTEQTFTTKDGLPQLTTTTITGITATTATSGGNITDDGGFGITARGVCYSTTINPNIADAKTVDGTGIGNYVSELTGLTVNTTYFVRAYATNSIGTEYGDEIDLFTGCKDYDGNIYNTVKIGNQVWMAENLKSTKYADGVEIPYITDNTAWTNLHDNNTDDAYCFYNNDASLGYGALYTYAAAVNGMPYNGINSVQGVCPTGWHLPSDAEWTEFENYLIANGHNYDGTTSGNKIGKSLASTSGWEISGKVGDVGNNQSSNNSTSFSALPGGYRGSYDGSFDSVGIYGVWWSSTESNSSSAYYRYLSYSNAYVYRSSNDKSGGFSVRCLRN